MTSPRPTDEDARGKFEARAWAEQYRAGMSRKEAHAFKRGHAAGWRDSEGFRRSVVATPSDDVRYCDHGDEMLREDKPDVTTWRCPREETCGRFEMCYRSAASAPPTITDDAAVDRAARAMYKMTASLSMSGARDLARAALRAALGGEA